MDPVHLILLNADNFLKTIVTTSTTTGAPAFIFDANDDGDVDGLGRLVQADETIYPDTSGVSHAFDYAYDMMSQLTSAKATNTDGLDWLQEDFTYNKDGNVADYDVAGSDSSSAATDYSYTNSGVSDIMAGATGDGAFTLSNDLNGNTTKLPTSSANDIVEYNWDNKLRFAQKGDFSIWVKYDPMGNRVWRQSDDGENTTTKKYVVDISGNLPTILSEYSDPNSLASQYIYADAQILCQYVGRDDPNVADQTYYYVHDRLGSVRLVVDCNMVDETVTARNIYTYSPFGNPYADTVAEAVYNPFQFTGQWFDPEINQYYLRARQYDPTMMRFMTRDPVRGNKKEPLTLHRYAYCLNDPVDNVDLTGEMGQSLVAPVVAGHLTHVLAVATVAYGVSTMNWEAIDLGITLDSRIGFVMAKVALGVHPQIAVMQALNKDGEMKGGKKGKRDSFGDLEGLLTAEELAKLGEKVEKYKTKEGIRGRDLTPEELEEVYEEYLWGY